MKKLLLFLSAMMLVFSVIVGHAIASTINVFSVTASSTHTSPWDVVNIINGVGLSGSPPLHAEITSSNAWMTADGNRTGSLIFDLGSTYTVTSTDVWQYGHWNVSPRGVKDFKILSSINGTDYTFVSNATLQQVGSTQLPNAAESFSFTTDAHYIKFDLL